MAAISYSSSEESLPFTSIQFITDAQGLHVTIETDRLYMRSVRSEKKDYEQYASLFGDSKVMAKFSFGQPLLPKEIRSRIDNIWAKRWLKNDPFSAFAVFKKDTGKFVGHVILGHGDAPGIAELAYLFTPSEWGKGYGSEASAAIVNKYALATISKGYLIDGSPLTKIIATARPDNPASIRILEKLGMHLIQKVEKFGSDRNLYSINIEELRKRISMPNVT